MITGIVIGAVAFIVGFVVGGTWVLGIASGMRRMFESRLDFVIVMIEAIKVHSPDGRVAPDPILDSLRKVRSEL